MHSMTHANESASAAETATVQAANASRHRIIPNIRRSHTEPTMLDETKSSLCAHLRGFIRVTAATQGVTSDSFAAERMGGLRVSTRRRCVSVNSTRTCVMLRRLNIQSPGGVLRGTTSGKSRNDLDPPRHTRLISVG